MEASLHAMENPGVQSMRLRNGFPRAGRPRSQFHQVPPRFFVLFVAFAAKILRPFADFADFARNIPSALLPPSHSPVLPLGTSGALGTKFSKRMKIQPRSRPLKHDCKAGGNADWATGADFCAFLAGSVYNGESNARHGARRDSRGPCGPRPAMAQPFAVSCVDRPV